MQVHKHTQTRAHIHTQALYSAAMHWVLSPAAVQTDGRYHLTRSKKCCGPTWTVEIGSISCVSGGRASGGVVGDVQGQTTAPLHSIDTLEQQTSLDSKIDW